MSDSSDPHDDAFRRQWAAELTGASSDEEAAWLPSTMQAAARAWARFSAGATVLLTEAGRRTAAALRSAETVVRDVAPAAGQLLLVASQAAAVTYAEHLNARYRRSDEALRARGWWALSSWGDDELDEFSELARSLGRRDFDREICRRYRAYDGRRLRRLVRAWSDEPAFKLADHLARRYRVSVPS
jgi:hypothetical protein